MMNKEQKNNYIKEMKNSFSINESIFVTHYQGLTVKQIEKLRSELRQHEIQFKITKNKITQLALEGTKCVKLANLFSGPTAVAFSADVISAAKILTRFSNNNEKLKILGGVMGEEILKVADVARIATFPTLGEAKVKIVSVLKVSAQKITSILLAPASKIAILALAKSKKS